MHKISQSTSSHYPGCYQPVSAAPGREENKQQPGAPAWSLSIRSVSSTAKKVDGDGTRQARQPAGHAASRWRAWLIGAAVLGGATCGYGYTRWRSGDTDGNSIDALMQNSRLPTPVALLAAQDAYLNNLPAEDARPGDRPLEGSRVDPYRSYCPRSKYQANRIKGTKSRKQNKEIIRFLKKNLLLNDVKKPNKFSVEELTAAVAKYLEAEKPLSEKNIARLILKASNLYGGNKNESLSQTQEKSAIINWLFENVLGSPPDIMLAKMAAEDNYPFMLTIDSMNFLLSPEGLQAEGKLCFNLLPEPEQTVLKSIWRSSLQKEIPLLSYYGSDPLVKGISLNDEEFAYLFTGSLFLYDNGINLMEISRQEANSTGELLWETALRDGAGVDMLKYYSLPALLFLAINYPEKITAMKNDNYFHLQTIAVNEYLEYKKIVQNALEDLDLKLNTYENAVKKWLTRGQLADSIIERCPQNAIFPLPNIASAIMTREQRYAQGKKGAKEEYLNSMSKPCKTAPDSVNDEYMKQTTNVADRFADLDEFLINFALATIEKTEQDFILSEKSIIHSLRIVPIIKANGIFPGVHDHGDYQYDFDSIKAADVFSVTVDKGKRCYALKGKPAQGYDIVRFDQAIPDDDSVNHNNFHPLITYAGGKPENSLIKDKDQKIQMLVSFLRNRHRAVFYGALYESGYTPSDLQKIWGVVKHIIPFHDCVAYASNNDLEQAIPACLLDAVSFFVVAGKAATLSGKFGSSIIKGLNKGAIVFAGNAVNKNTLKATGAQFLQHISLPTVKDISSLGVHVLRAADPGFELMPLLGKKSFKKIITLLEKYKGEIKLDGIITKLKAAELKNILPSSIKPDHKLKLPGSEIPIPVKKIGHSDGQDIVAAVNCATGEVFGNRYKIDIDRRLVLMENKKTGSLKPASNSPSRQMSRLDKPDMPKIKFMEQDNINHGIHFAHNNNQLVDITHIPGPTTFMQPMDHYYAFFYPNKLDRTQDIIKYIKDSYHSDTIYLHRYGENVQNIPLGFDLLKNNINIFYNELTKAHDNAKAVLDKLQRTTMPVNEKLQYYKNNPIKSYLSGVLQTKDEKILVEAMTRLKRHSDKIVNYFNNYANNVIFATSSTATKPYIHRIECPMGFTYADDVNRRVIIMVDNFNTAPIVSTKPHLTILHEISHHSGSLDFLISPSTSLVGDASEFREVFDDALHSRNGESITIDPDFIRAYNHDHQGAVISEQQFIALMRRDPMLQANAFMDNADFIAKIISDIAVNRPFNQDYLSLRHKRDALEISFNNMVTLLYKTAMVNTDNQ
ncbi:hypothetical protein [Acerihabitans arboris]|uniref:Uncharacterized protein n=1 Tax=Acerihabitans arboris TaxID=2691583 RepID=A0A845SF58_9GAMM|nr:hypothetical protein [Acerihabitans arboris]NDL63450.1 hypothetical protein [Acerihabitans arboris]